MNKVVKMTLIIRDKVHGYILQTSWAQLYKVLI